eukprot:scpid80414/ scgid13915/ 
MNSPLSHNILSGMMKRLSDVAGLLEMYTNHCLRVTSITLMKKAGLEDRKIMAVSGHKSVASLQSYDRPTSSYSRVPAAAIDRKALSPATNAVARSLISASSAVCETAVANSPLAPYDGAASLPSSAGVQFAGSTLHNVTFNVTTPVRKKKLRLKLKTKA